VVSVCVLHLQALSLINHVQVLVVDNIVYDCTNFMKEHPGGEQVLQSFGGAECSWQFWRFHGQKEMGEFGRPLRVGRTSGMVNKFQEPSKYVGLRRLCHDDW
jgi:cytochrome b involved in lipid metabolism